MSVKWHRQWFPYSLDLENTLSSVPSAQPVLSLRVELTLSRKLCSYKDNEHQLETLSLAPN